MDTIFNDNNINKKIKKSKSTRYLNKGKILSIYKDCLIGAVRYLNRSIMSSLFKYQTEKEKN